MDDGKLQFKASIPMIKSALIIGGDTASQIKLEIPASEIANAMRLVSYTEKPLIITVKIDEQEGVATWES